MDLDSGGTATYGNVEGCVSWWHIKSCSCWFICGENCCFFWRFFSVSGFVSIGVFVAAAGCGPNRCCPFPEFGRESCFVSG